MSDHNLAEALRALLSEPDRTPEQRPDRWRAALKALAAHEAEQQAGEAVGEVLLTIVGESTYARLYAALPAGTKLFTHPQQPLTEEQMRLERRRIDPMAEDMDAWSFGQGVRFAERAHGIGITKDTK